MYIKPIQNKQIPDPVRGGYLPEQGGEVDDNDMYWQRRINDGDVEVVPVIALAVKLAKGA